MKLVVKNHHILPLPHREGVAFTPKGGCPLKLDSVGAEGIQEIRVAFTPKGGCPLKQP